MHEGQINEQGTLNGFARVIYDTEDYYIGWYKDNMRHGYGKYAFSHECSLQEGLF